MQTFPSISQNHRLGRSIALTGAVAVFILAGAGSALAQQAPNDTRAGFNALDRKDFAGAENFYTHAINSGELKGRELAITDSNRGIARYELKYVEAISDYDRSLKMGPLETTYNNRGNALAKPGRREAMDDLGYATVLDPTDAVTPVERAQVSRRLRSPYLNTDNVAETPGGTEAP